MHGSARLASIAGLAVAAAAAIAVPAAATAQAATPSATTATSSHAVFVQTDDPAGNAVVAYRRAGDGSLTMTGSYPTGGLGGVLDGSVVDHLASQGSLQYDRARSVLYAVNAGSNTLSVFDVRGTTLHREQVIGTRGSFPVSIAVRGPVVYVLNARDGASLQGYLRVGDRLVAVPAWHRTLGLDTAGDPEFTHTPGQVAITPDGAYLLVTTKAGGDSVEAFALQFGGGLRGRAVVTPLTGTVPFAMAFDSRGHLLIAQAGTSAVSTFRVRWNGTLAARDTAATGQAATCWIVASGRTAWASNAGSANLSAYATGPTGTLTALGTTTTDAGTVDAAVTSGGQFLYVQTGAAGVVDGFRVGAAGALTPAGSVTVPGAVGAEGIATD